MNIFSIEHSDGKRSCERKKTLKKYAIDHLSKSNMTLIS